MKKDKNMSAQTTQASKGSSPDVTGGAALIQAPINKVRCDLNWNGRGAGFLAADDPEKVSDSDVSTFGQLKQSIKVDGLKDPIELRPNPDAKRDGKEYMVVAGFRRFMAVSQLNDEKHPPPGMPKGTITALFDPNMTERQARWRNAEENFNRSDVTYADRVQYVKNIRGEDTAATQDDFQKVLGLSQGYTSKLFACCDLDSKVFNAWRDSAVGVKGGIDTMVGIARSKDKKDGSLKVRPPAEQWAMWQKAIDSAKAAAEPSTDEEKRASKIKSICNAAAEVGTIVGTLVKLEVIDAVDVDWSAVLPEMPGIKYPKDVTMGEKKEIRAAAFNAYEGVVNPPSEKDEKGDKGATATN